MGEIPQPDREAQRQEFQARREFVKSGPWSEAAKEFFLRRVDSTVQFKTEEERRRRLDFIDANVPSDVLSAAARDIPAGGRLARLLQTREALLTSVHETLGQDAWEDILRSQPEWVDTLGKLRMDAALVAPPPGRFESFAAREAVPVVLDAAGPDRERDLEDLREALRETGFEPIVRRVTAAVRVTEAESENDAHGVYEGSTKEIGIWSAGDRRFMLPPVLFHETGHGVNWLIGSYDRGQEWFDRYAVSVVLRPESSSWYAESYRLEYAMREAATDMVKGHTSRLFLMESFAEDFRNYWIDQDHVMPERRKILDELCDALFPDVDRDEVRVKIRTYMRRKYDVHAAEKGIDPTDCDRAEEKAKTRDAVRVEEARQRAEALAAKKRNPIR